MYAYFENAEKLRRWLRITDMMLGTWEVPENDTLITMYLNQGDLRFAQRHARIVLLAAKYVYLQTEDSDSDDCEYRIVCRRTMSDWGRQNHHHFDEYENLVSLNGEEPRVLKFKEWLEEIERQQQTVIWWAE